MKRRGTVGLVALLGVIVLGGWAYADAPGLELDSGPGQELVAHFQSVQVPGMPDYDWWYGCSPTSAGMVLGKYDRDGYGSLTHYYSNIAPGGDAETRLDTTVPNPRTSYPYATSMIASSGHVQDFYAGGYQAYGDDNYQGRAFDCLADFMGTSQDNTFYDGSTYYSPNGGSVFFNYTDGSKVHYYEFPGFGTNAYGYSYANASGMYGIYEYLAYSGYGADVVNMYNQYIIEMGYTYGFSLADYMAEIDAGRPVVIHLEGHTMVGFGYDPQSPSTIYIDDTWGAGTTTMTWGGSYANRDHYGVTVIDLKLYNIPEPSTLILFALSVVGCGYARRRRKAA